MHNDPAYPPTHGGSIPDPSDNIMSEADEQMKPDEAAAIRTAEWHITCGTDLADKNLAHCYQQANSKCVSLQQQLTTVCTALKWAYRFCHETLGYSDTDDAMVAAMKAALVVCDKAPEMARERDNEQNTYTVKYFWRL